MGLLVGSWSAVHLSKFFQGLMKKHPLSSPHPPAVQFKCTSFTHNEFVRVVTKTKASSAPSLFDRVGYRVFKRCPALVQALSDLSLITRQKLLGLVESCEADFLAISGCKAISDLFNTCWSQAVIPAQWKVAAIQLIAKELASQDSTNPSNFCPIALTSCIGKLSPPSFAIAGLPTCCRISP